MRSRSLRRILEAGDLEPSDALAVDPGTWPADREEAPTASEATDEH